MQYKIPLFDLNFDCEEENAIISTLRSKWISMGPRVEEFENKFSSHIGCKYAVAVTNCTAALHLALRALNIKEGDEVIVPSLTFVATANVIRYVNATPVFADVISLENLTIDPEDIKNKITKKTKAIIVMHYAGYACEMNKIIEIAKNNNLFLIEDCAHSPNSEYNDRKLGSFGDISCFSFFSNKNITCAEGGILLTNNEEYFDKVKLLRSHGMTSVSYDRAKGHATEYDVVDLGYNYRIDDIRASILIVQFKKLDQDIKKRELLRNYYIDLLSQEKEITMPFKNFPFKSSSYIFSIVLKKDLRLERDFIRKRLTEYGIQTSVHYPAAHKFKIFNNHVSLPKTEFISENLITLPLYYKLEYSDIKYIYKSINCIISND